MVTRIKIDVWKVKLIMAQKGMSRLDVSAWGDMTTNTVGNILNRGYANAKSVHKLAKCLGCQVTDIVLED